MPSETIERRPSRQFNNHHHQLTANQPPVAENLPCPRCESTTTKFCYYNNYNMSQPRYFCKSCRRYWTQGGTLRNIPVGGGTRKHSKRSRISSNSSPSSSCSSITHDPKLQSLPVSLFKPDLNTFLSNGSVNDVGVVSNGFSALLNAHGPGFLALSGGAGYGATLVGTGFDEMGYSLTRNAGFWSFPDVGADSSSVASSRRNTCPVSGSLEGGWPDVDCFGWPDLAISMPGNGLK